MPKRKTIKKIHVLGLGTGYVETASWATVLLVHRRGFKCIQDALDNLNILTLEYCRQTIKYEQESNERQKKFCADHGVDNRPIYENVPDDAEAMIVDVWHDIIHGTMQDHGDMWELLAGQGWEANAAWVGPSAAKHGICWIENSPELISEAPSWGEQKVFSGEMKPDGKYEGPNALSYASSHMHHIPKGVKKFRSEVK